MKNLKLSQPNWVERDYVTNIKLEPNKNPSLFDSDTDLYGEDYSFQYLTVRELSESHKFSIDYLGDFFVQCGVRPPIDIDKPIGDYLVGHQIESLIIALNSLDPVEASLEYDNPTIFELAYQLGVAPAVLIDVCSKENFNLPFGKDTALHDSVVGRLCEIVNARQETKLTDDDENENNELLETASVNG